MRKREKEEKTEGLSRRGFMRSVVGGSLAAGAALTIPGVLSAQEDQEADSTGRQTAKPEAPKPPKEDEVKTNIGLVEQTPRTANSMPGPFPGVVCEVTHPRVVQDMKVDPAAAAAMLAAGMTSLTGAKDPREAWARFFTSKDRVGIKINPIGGKLLSNSHELVREIIVSLEGIGVPRKQIVLWDRREEQMIETGFTAAEYPGITCLGTEYMVREEEREIWKGMDRLDQSVFYEFDIEGKYDEETLPYMLNGGTKSYFTKILTEMVDKVINVPVLKNAGPSVTLCLKNMAFGATSNTGRGHAIWNRYIAEVCAFPPVRDKTVLNIIDGFRGCYEGGPAALARYIWNANTLWVSTDPVAADRIGWEMIFAKRIKEGIAQPEDWDKGLKRVNKLERAERLGLGVFDRGSIDHRKIALA